jgi:hypothetical protein
LSKLAGSLIVEVTDNGAGIAPENTGKVFGEFSQFEKNKLQGGGGSGLGLWISRRIMHLHGGSLNFHSEGLGKGCTFYLCLPIYDVQSLDDLRISSKIRKRMTSLSISNLRLFKRIQPSNVSESTQQANEVSINCIYTTTPAADHENPSLSIANFTALESASDKIQPSQPPNSRRLKILIVDDSSVNRKVNIKIVSGEPELAKDPLIIEADDGDVAIDLMDASIAEGRGHHMSLGAFSQFKLKL